MIPLWISLRVRSGKRATIHRLGLPLFLLWLLLLPLLVLLAPFALVACLVMRFNPLRHVAAGWSVLSAMRGTRVDVEAPGALVFIHVY
jgi:hypothetical protein